MKSPSEHDFGWALGGATGKSSLRNGDLLLLNQCHHSLLVTGKRARLTWSQLAQCGATASRQSSAYFT